MSVKRKPEHVQRAREILALQYQDALAVLGELLADYEEDLVIEYQRGYDACLREYDRDIYPTN